MRRIAETLHVQNQAGSGSHEQQQHDDQENLQADTATLALHLHNTLRPLLELLVGRIEEALFACRGVISLLLILIGKVILVGDRVLIDDVRFRLCNRKAIFANDVETRCVDQSGNRLRGVSIALRNSSDSTLIVDACRSGQEVRLVFERTLEIVNRLVHLTERNISLAEACIHLVAHVGCHVELQCAFVRSDGIRGTVERHEAHAQVEQCFRGIGIRFVKSGLAERNASLSRLALLEQSIAHRSVSLVRRGIRTV